MARNRKQLPTIKGVEITGVAAEGKSIAKIKLREEDENPIVVFIPYGAPGDVADIKIDKKKHNFAEAHITVLHKPSAMRVEARCKNFGVCGGCKWQHLPYEEQLKFKRQQVVDALERIAKIEIPEVNATLGSEQIWRYRNKMEYTFSNKRWRSWEEIRGEVAPEGGDEALGFHIPGSFDKVLHINECYLQDSIGDRIRNYLYSKALEWNDEEHSKSAEAFSGESFYDIKNNKGLFRTLMIRPVSTREVMVCVVFGDDAMKNTQTGQEGVEQNIIESICRDLCEAFPEITTLVYVVNKKLNDSISDQDVVVYKGSGYVEEKMGNLRFRISAKSFYQTNSEQAHELYKTAARYAGLLDDAPDGEKPLVYDLYTGAGTIANFVAGKARKVIGIEYVEDAVADARINSEINGIKNTEFYAGDMKDILTDEFISRHGRPEVMIVDPPRAGMHEDVVKVILNASPDVIVYVSCNPATQARDLALLDAKYRVTDVQPVDMFPHTHHVENVVRLVKKQTED